MCKELLAIARRYVAAGLCVIPVRADGSKAPSLGTWKEYQRRLPNETELERWFGGEVKLGLAIVCGAVSRNLEVLDFDDAGAWERWQGLMLPIAAALLSAPLVLTPKGGRHLYVFRGRAGPCRKLAFGEVGRKTLIEVKAEGGYVLAPGCRPECHPSGRIYVWERPLMNGAMNGYHQR